MTILLNLCTYAVFHLSQKLDSFQFELRKPVLASLGIDSTAG